jgi:hypothetical protein
VGDHAHSGHVPARRHIPKGNPADGPLLVPAVERIKARFARAPGRHDRGYGEAKVGDELAVILK